MSKLDELIQELCPDGVEYKKLSEAVSIERGKRVTREQLSADGNYPVYQNSLTPLGFYSQYNYPANTTFIIVAGAAGEIGYSTTEFWSADDCFPLVCGDDILSRYLYHVILNQKPIILSKVRKASIPRLPRSAIEKLRIPVPPLEVQREIVRILDNFSETTQKLEEELRAELTARQKQYEYYRDKLLTFDVRGGGTSDVIWRTLGEISTIARGASPRPIKNYITTNADGVNWIKIGDAKAGSKYITETAEKITPEGAKKSRLVKNGDFILSNSMSFGRPYIIKTQGCIHDGWLSISGFERYLTPDFLYHLLSSNNYQRIMRQKASFGGAVQNLNADIVKEIRIPLPPLDVQQRIVSILDRFDALCNDLSSGLPAEIEARQKQYEYYRDKLLTFKEKAV